MHEGKHWGRRGGQRQGNPCQPLKTFIWGAGGNIVYAGKEHEYHSKKENTVRQPRSLHGVGAHGSRPACRCRLYTDRTRYMGAAVSYRSYTNTCTHIHAHSACGVSNVIELQASGSHLAIKAQTAGPRLQSACCHNGPRQPASQQQQQLVQHPLVGQGRW